MMWRFSDPPIGWHKWFAWRPVFASYDGGIALCWLQFVERRYDQGFLVQWSSPWDYRVIGHVD